nr:hypothetical protein BaRGS_024515 [Batillaria attramentaria]
MLKTVLSDPKVAEEVFDVGDSQTLSEGNQIGDVDQDNSGKAYQQFLKTQLQAILDNCQLRLNLIEEVEEWLNMEAGFSAAGILTSAADILEDDEPEQCWQSFFAEGEKLKGKSMMLVELGQKLLQLLSELKIGVKELTAARQRE